MSKLGRFMSLSNKERALVAVAVMLDGLDAVELLQSDKDRRQALTRAAADVAGIAPDLRLPLLGTLLRSALEELKRT